jgi:hypothetical protein
LSPIFVRPVREQLEHDRLIRFLAAKYKRKFEVAANIGDELTMPLKLGAATFFPDLVLTDGKKLAGLVEVESGESVNNLEAMAQWVHFARARVPFHLYVPVHVYDAARRLCEANHVRVAEIWTYRSTADGFDLVRLFHDAAAGTSSGRAPAPKGKPAVKPVAKPVVPKPVVPKPVVAKPVVAKPPAKPAAKPAAKTKAPKAAKSAPAKKKKR